MKKDEFNRRFRDYASTLSPTETERRTLASIYQSFFNLLGQENCLQIGSYPRYTAITPIHDLDILYILGHWGGGQPNPSEALQKLKSEIERNYQNPTQFSCAVSVQSHSVTVSYLSSGKEVFSVDIVPAYRKDEKNEFGDDTYKVPEIANSRQGTNRRHHYARLREEGGSIKWIDSDPRGYIKVAHDLDQSTNGEFRRTVKLVKKWKTALKAKDEKLNLKSFHLEQVIVGYFQNNQGLEIFDAIFKFFVELPEIIDNPNQIRDRANHNAFIDDYLKDLTKGSKERIKQARDYFLVSLENFSGGNECIGDLFSDVGFFERLGTSEEFLFDYGIPVLIEEPNFTIDGYLQQKKGGFRPVWLSQMKNPVSKWGEKIEFSIRKDVRKDYTLWKVQNDKECREARDKRETRGEITRNQTSNHPEITAYIGDHYVECFAVKNNVCIARAKIEVRIRDSIASLFLPDSQRGAR